MGETKPTRRSTSSAGTRKATEGARTRSRINPPTATGQAFPHNYRANAKHGHSTKDCRVSKSVECNACKKTAHLKVACMQELRKQGSSKPEVQKARAFQEESDSSSGEDSNFEKVNYVSHGTGARKHLYSTCDYLKMEKVAKVKGTPDTGCTSSLKRKDIVNRNKIMINKLVRLTAGDYQWRGPPSSPVRPRPAKEQT